VKKLLLVLVATVLMLSTLTGCTKEADLAQGVTEDTVKVGNSIAVSGALAFVGVPFKAGIEAYFKMVNDNGGVDGRMIEYVHTDDEFNPEKGKAAFDYLVNDEKVFALVGHFGTPIVGATLEDIKDVGIPAVYFATGTGILYNENATGRDRSAYPVQPVYPMEGRILGAWALGQFNASKVGVIYTNDDAGKDLLGGIQKEIDGVLAEQVPPGAEDVSAAVTKLKDQGVDVVIVAAIQSTFPQIIKEMAKQGLHVPTLTTYVNVSSNVVDVIKDDVAGQFDIYGNAWVDIASENMAEFGEWVAKVSDEDFSLNAFAMTGWIAAHFFVEGLERVDGDLNWENYMDAIESAPIENPFGGMIDFSNGQRLGTQEMSLVKMNPDVIGGWEAYVGFKSIEEILK
jgi:ABC-type branched-subunit amino acid transport system substrate-binding protein